MANQLDTYEAPAMMGAWYNNFGDLWSDLRTGAEWITRQGRTVTQAGQVAQNTVQNASHITDWRVSGKLVVGGAALIGGLLLVRELRRKKR